MAEDTPRTSTWLGLLIGTIVTTLLITTATTTSCTRRAVVDARAHTAGTAPPSPSYGGRLVFGVSAEADGYLPHVNRWSASAHNIGKAVMDPLVVLGVDGNSHPYLAAGIYPVDTTFLEWDVVARPEVAFHNGERFDADALLLNLETYRVSPLSAAAFRPVAAIRKVDDEVVRVTMAGPWANFPTLFTSQAGYMAAPAQIRAGDTRHPIGTGPFVFGDWSPGQPLTVTRNPAYWRQGLPYLDEVEFQFIGDVGSRHRALEAGDVDILHTKDSFDVVRMAKDGDIPDGTRLIVDETEGDEFTVILNTQSGIFRDRDMRLALAHATDRQGLVDSLFDGYFDVADEPFGAASRWYGPVDFPGFDPARAAQLVDAYERAHGGAAPAFTHTIVSSNEDSRVAQALQDMWTRAGFVVTIEGLQETAYAADLVLGSFDSVQVKHFNNPDPDGDFMFYSASTLGGPGELSINFPRYANETTEAALAEGRANIEPDVRRRAYARLWHDWAENVPYIWIYHSRWAFLHDEDVHGIGDVRAPDGAAVPPILWGSTFLTATWIEPR